MNGLAVCGYGGDWLMSGSTKGYQQCWWICGEVLWWIMNIVDKGGRNIVCGVWVGEQRLLIIVVVRVQCITGGVVADAGLVMRGYVLGFWICSGGYL